MERWNSVKDATAFQKNYKKGFAQNRFKREQFKNIESRTPSVLIHSTYSYIKDLKERINSKGVTAYDR